MPSREFLWIVEESSYGTPIASPVTGTSAFYARLHQDDTFTGQSNPVLLDIMYGGGRATPACQSSDQFLVPFNFTTYLYAGPYTQMLLKWCMVPIDSGRTLPWTTTDPNLVMPPGDLASLSFYHAFQQPDGTYDRRRYGGAKCLTWSLTCSRQEPRAILSVTGVAIRDDLNAAGTAAFPTATEFPAPAETDYPCGVFMFSHTAGNLILVNTGSTARTLYNSVGISCTNAMDPRSFESKYMMLCKFCGRTTTLNASVYLKPTPDDLAWLQNQQALTTSLKFDNGTNTVKIDLNTKNYLKSVARNLALDKVYVRNLTAQNFWDPTVASGDLSLTVT